MLLTMLAAPGAWAQDSGNACAMSGNSCAIIVVELPGTSEAGHYGDGNGKAGQNGPTAPDLSHTFVTPQTYTDGAPPYAIGMQSNGGNGGHGRRCLDGFPSERRHRVPAAGVGR
jgi:hypothetical protein